ncbi:MAG: hypothetical protein OWT28_13755 [Firmicutes bacterium]|nr:hypothetical protein [Bacillota bacterium]
MQGSKWAVMALSATIVLTAGSAPSFAKDRSFSAVHTNVAQDRHGHGDGGNHGGGYGYGSGFGSGGNGGGSYGGFGGNGNHGGGYGGGGNQGNGHGSQNGQGAAVAGTNPADATVLASIQNLISTYEPQISSLASVTGSVYGSDGTSPSVLSSVYGGGTVTSSVYGGDSVTSSVYGGNSSALFSGTLNPFSLSQINNDLQSLVSSIFTNDSFNGILAAFNQLQSDLGALQQSVKASEKQASEWNRRTQGLENKHAQALARLQADETSLETGSVPNREFGKIRADAHQYQETCEQLIQLYQSNESSSSSD